MHSHYGRLAAMAALSFVAMFVLMYAMVDRPAHVHPNLNQVYMAGLMTAPMVAIEVLLMGAMYRNRTLNVVLIAASVLGGVLLFAAIRQQTAIGDVQFLKSMIPHHSGAVLMCARASLRDTELRSLCAAIIKNQEDEIARMELVLRRLAP